MYLRWKQQRAHTHHAGVAAINPETGQPWRVWSLQLVEAKRQDGKVRQRIVKHLCNISEEALCSGEVGWRVYVRKEIWTRCQNRLREVLGTRALSAQWPYLAQLHACVPYPTYEEEQYASAYYNFQAKLTRWIFTHGVARERMTKPEEPQVPALQPVQFPVGSTPGRRAGALPPLPVLSREQSDPMGAIVQIFTAHQEEMVRDALAGSPALFQRLVQEATGQDGQVDYAFFRRAFYGATTGEAIA
jgi:hypothetical protein